MHKQQKQVVEGKMVASICSSERAFIVIKTESCTYGWWDNNRKKQTGRAYWALRKL